MKTEKIGRYHLFSVLCTLYSVLFSRRFSNSEIMTKNLYFLIYAFYNESAT